MAAELSIIAILEMQLADGWELAVTEYERKMKSNEKTKAKIK